MSARHIVGFHPVREALRKEPESVLRVLVEQGRGGQRRREIEALCKRCGVPWSEVPAAELSRRARGIATNGFGAELAAPIATAGSERTGDPELAVLAEDIQDPRNLGALLRVCEGAGVGRFFLREHGSAPIGEAAEKASAGAAGWVPVERIGSPADLLERLKGEGYWIYELGLDGEAPWSVDLTGKVLLCVGGEEKGLRRRTRQACDRTLTLPMRGRVESLNLATAAAAVLYEALRQRGAGGAAAQSGSPTLSDRQQQR
ncbi:MAG: RNA methyltransferase [Holophagales bacterium]|nr:RNA methyltransferase [Holophagales bacterium]